jgi:prepilin-type N-terminal cleavage/methylation domain-containing protein
MIESRNPQSGFTLVEMAVALGVTAVVMLGILFLFDFNNKLTRVQANVADMQQSLRIAQYDMVRMARMAGRGGLALNQGVAITTAGDATYLIPGGPKVLAGTDVLTLRGVFSTPVFQISFTNPLSLRLNPPNPATATSGLVEICKLSPTGQVQDLKSLLDAFNRLAAEPEAEAVILVSPLDDRFYKVVALDPTQTSEDDAQTCPKTGPKPWSVTLGFKVVGKYDALSAPPANAQLALEKVGYVGILEEYRFYVREDYAIPGKPESGLAPVLSRARFYPGTTTPYVSPDNPGEDNLRQDIADGVVDLQMALGFDVNGDGDVVERLDRPGEDEWQGNAAGEAALGGGFKDLRISTLVRTNRPDNTYEAPVLPRVEDHVYSLTDAQDRINGTTARKYRRRLLQTIVNLRNLTT